MIKMYNKLSDIELIALLKDEDGTAFTEIYSRYWTVLYLHGRKMLRDDEEARDVVQELFTHLWKNAALIVITESLSSYLYRSVRNRVFNLIEHKKIINDYQKSLVQFLDAGELVTDELIREKELSALIEKEIQLLPPKMRTVFELSRKQHLSYKEIGAQLGISDHTVRRQVSNALSILRTKLGVSAGVVYLLLLRG
jgi:RNA polymerase sigma-70 factor (ECF subfamily)